MSTPTVLDADVAIVRSGFAALAGGDVAGFGAMFRADASWNHRNDDRLGGVHHGRDGILAFLGESMQLTAGTLRPVPQSFMADGAGRVVIIVHITGTRPDGRSLDDQQVLLATLDGDRVATIDQFIGNPAAVTAFWA